MMHATRVLRGRRSFNPVRPRWWGPLNSEELAWCRTNGVPVGYDPAQIGWVTLASEEASGAPIRGPLRFRRWRADDARVFRTLLDDPEVWRHLPERYPAPLTEGLVWDLLELAALTEHHDVRAIEREGEPVGQIRLAFVPGVAGRESGEISYWLGRRWWGRGIATEVIWRFSELCFAERPDLLTVVARVHRDNAASARALGKAGYWDEGSAPEDPAIRIFRRDRTDPGG